MSEGYIEKALLKLARQLNAYDEASLSDLWNKYETIVSNFEPTRQWEEAAVVFGMIQSIRLKNQLFNLHWSRSNAPDNLVSRPLPGSSEDDLFSARREQDKGSESGPDDGGSGGKRSKVLRFRPRDDG